MGLISKVKDALHGDHTSSDKEREIDNASTRTIASTNATTAGVTSATTAATTTVVEPTTTTVVEGAAVGATAVDTATLLPPKEVNVTDMGVVHEETHVAPEVVQEKIHRAHHEEITPVIDRQTERVQVNQVVQPVLDKQQDIRHEEKVNAAITNEVVEAIP